MINEVSWLVTIGKWIGIAFGLLLLPWQVSGQDGFISLDCGGTGNFTDTIGIKWMPDLDFVSGGFSGNTSGVNSRQYQTVRFFNGSQPKYCYTLPVTSSSRYLIRATFLYGNFDSSNTFPGFEISLDATAWAMVQIENSTQLYFKEIIVSTQLKSSVSVCIIKGSVGVPFISTLELRELQASMYAKSYDSTAYLKYAQRINFGASSTDFIRYPDDPVDRIWESDIAKRGNGLTNEASGTIRINTARNVTNTGAQERPPSKVMQTAVVGTYGTLTYRLAIPDFPGIAWAKTFLAEIQDLNSTDVRKFTFILRNDTKYAGQAVDLENDFGAYFVYEPGFDSIQLPELTNFAFMEANGSNLGPILNAMEILEVVSIVEGTSSNDATVLLAFKALSPKADWATEAGDSCLPVPWDWVKCNSASPPRVSEIVLSLRNLTGQIPSGISQMMGLVNLWLDHNRLSGSVPDLSQLANLRILHLENNQLNGTFPQYLADLPSLQELYVQNNHLSGTIPRSLLKRSNLTFQYYGNPNLKLESSKGSHWRLIVAAVVSGAVAIIAAASSALYFLFIRHRKGLLRKAATHKRKSATEANPPSQAYLLPVTSPLPSVESNIPEFTRYFSLTELEEATEKFSKKIGQGGFGPVYYGNTKDGKEIAVKVLSADSHQGNQEFLNEVNLLSRIHHRNLVSFYGYCHDNNERMLVYEYMHEGTLRDHLFGAAKERTLGWSTRLQMALDAAKGLDYLHTGCIPSIIHRDVKSSNILVNNKMEAKVSDFGLSKGMMDDATHISSTVRGTVGYLDPEYYISQQLTEKSDVYSFGVVLLELISGKGPVSTQDFGSDHNIVQWARSLLQKGDIFSMIDPNLGTKYSTEALWKVAEIAICSVDPNGFNRPKMSEIVQELHEAIQFEKRNQDADSDSETESRHSRHSTTLSSPGPMKHPDYAVSESTSTAWSDPAIQPSVR